MQNLARLQVVVLNSTTGDELEYEECPRRQLIAVGGNRLFRGLTLEGLTIAYSIAHDVFAHDIADFLRRFEGHPNSVAFQGAESADWIMERSTVGNW